LTGFPRFFGLGLLSSIAKRGILQGFAEVASTLRVGRGSKRSSQARLILPQQAT
jgi:hypothetical protein